MKRICVSSTQATNLNGMGEDISSVRQPRRCDEYWSSMRDRNRRKKRGGAHVRVELDEDKIVADEPENVLAPR